MEPRYKFWKRKTESQTQSNVFSYNKLSRRRREIRLCILDPGAIDDPLTCALRTVSLREHPIYETLSYTWGDPTLNNDIVANGRVIKITKNLYTALWYLRKSDEPRVIWADGICINQSDLDERSSQVGIMGDVYRKGKKLQVWLGEAEEMESFPERSTPRSSTWHSGNDVSSFMRFLQSQKIMKTLPPIASMVNPSPHPFISIAMEILELLATGRHLYQMPFFKVTGPETVEPCPTWAASLRVLSIILSRPWWTRVWIFQEVVLSTQATVNIGGYKIPLSLILNAMASLKKHAFSCCDPWQYLCYGYEDIGSSFYDCWGTISGLADLIDNHQACEITLDNALHISAGRKASDSRDHVYALQGLLKKDLKFTNPNYQISTQKVYSRATKMLFSEGMKLDTLNHAVGTQINNAHGLASWVCDWSRTSAPTVLGHFLFNASNGRKFRTKQTADRILTVEAYKVDIICATGTTICQDNVLRKRLEALEAWRSLAEFEKSIEKSAIWTTILAGLYAGAGEIRRIMPEDLVDVEAWWKLATSLVVQGGYNVYIPLTERKMRVIDEYISYLMPLTRFWSTSQGFLGLGRQTVEKGDEVFIVKGSRVPLILRPIKGSLLPQFGLSEGEQGYLFVSDCYLHGFMDGEAVKSDTKWQPVHLC